MELAEAYQQLQEQLERLGWADQKDEREIRSKMALGLPRFRVDREMKFGQDQVRFSLLFQESYSEKNEFSLQEIKASYRGHIGIPDVVDGMDITGLQKTMGLVEWTGILDHKPYWGWASSSDLADLKDLISDLRQLYTAGNGQGSKIADLLKVKYFTGSPFEDPALDDLLRQYFKEQAFYIENFASLNYSPQLCYQSVSGKLPEITAALNAIVSGSDIHLERLISTGQEQFELETYRNHPDGVIRCLVPFTRDGQFSYHIGDYEAAVRLLPIVAHGVFDDIDTAELEREMQSEDWMEEHGHYSYSESEQEPQFRPHIEQLITMLQYQLPEKGPEAAQIASYLQAKYWAGSPDFSGVMDENAWKFLESLPSRTAVFPPEIPLGKAFNLLMGRGCYLGETDEGKGRWLVMAENEQEPGLYREAVIESYGMDRLRSTVDLLRSNTDAFLPRRNLDAYLKRLADGKRVALGHYEGKTLLAEACPQKESLKLFRENGSPFQVPIVQHLPRKMVSEISLKPISGANPVAQEQNKQLQKKKKSKGKRPGH